MPIDASIALGVRPPQFESPVNAMAKIMQLKGLQQDQEMNTMRADEYRRGVDRQNRLMGLMQGGSDPEALRRGGFLKEAAEWEKNSADTGKTKADTRAKEIEATAKRLDIAGQAFGHVRANPTLETAMSTLDYLQQNGVYSPEQVTGFKQAVSADPTKIAQLADMAFRASLQAKDQLAKFDTRNIGGSTQTTAQDPVTGRVAIANSVQNTQSPDSVASGQVQMRGQNMSDARARERLAFDQAQPKGVLDPERGLLVDPRTGEARPVTMGGKPVGMKEKPLTEGQAKAALFGSRMEASDKIIGQLAEKGATTSIPGSRAGYGVGATLNLVAPAAQQQLDQAKRDFINATLRRESGAVISEPEFANAEQQYFPQIGDKPEVIKQKAQNRALAIRGVQAEVPKSSDAVRRITGDGAGQPKSTQGGDSDPLGIR